MQRKHMHNIYEKGWEVLIEDDDENLPINRAPTAILSRTAANESLALKTSNVGNIGIAHTIGQICADLVGVLQDLGKCRKFLSYRNEDAQRLLDSLQSLLDYSPMEGPRRILFVQALVRLCRKSELYPQCFTLTGVTHEGEPITDGHSGEIYRGKFQKRVVSVKVVKVYDRSDQARLFKAFSREAVLWGQLSHANVLPFYGVFRLGDKRNRIGLVSPWMQNGNVNEFLEKKPDADRVLLILDVAIGILYLHNHGVVHGDLKGANILVTDSGRACLADFGLSSVTAAHGLKNQDLSSNDPQGGTVRYQAPELINQDSPSPRSQASDIYAFALVCYRILTGNRPFPQVVNDYAVLVKVGAGERPGRPFGQIYLDRGLTGPMWELMKDCWEHVPGNRPNADQIVGRLRRENHGNQRHDIGWGELSPSRLRASGGYGHSSQNDVLLSEMLRFLRAPGIF